MFLANRQKNPAISTSFLQKVSYGQMVDVRTDILYYRVTSLLIRSIISTLIFKILTILSFPKVALVIL